MKIETKGTYQLPNGMWAFRAFLVVDGVKKDVKRTKDEFGNPFKTEKSALKARERALALCELDIPMSPKKKRYTVNQVWKEYCEKGRYGKSYGTTRKQDSLWRNHISKRFGKKYIDDISVSQVVDYLSELYYEEGRAFKYVESFLKMFYLIFGQAYSRGYLDVDKYNTLCVNKNSKIHMPKMKTDDEDEIISFSNEEIVLLDEYFKGTNGETAYLIGKNCGLRINECYGLKWSDIDFENDCIYIQRQIQYQEGLYKMTSLKTRNARRTVYMNSELKNHLLSVKKEVEESSKKIPKIRNQNQTIIIDVNGKPLSSLLLVNSLPNGKIQTLNSMKYHSKKIKETLRIDFKFHYLRHTYGTKLAEINTPTHLLCNQMGHASGKVTERYYIAMSHQGIDIIKNKLENIYPMKITP